ncbi:serine hydrolase domain-containing protein [Psychrobacillus sp.]|uniref:serine hydrolase domain-containing protein n=1 Tax=Psychrobacillus sp. TaxID=1871623 RepID=UPI0028BF2A44|nr:serine hydrolase domain-containing protein [Psychrobacillus sp.]
MIVEKMSKEIDQYCNEIVEKYKIPGFAIGLAKEGELLWGKGFGYRDVEKELPVTMDTVFGIASVTKSFTCVAIMQLQEAGKLSVHDPIITYLPEFKTPDDKQTEQITIHHLMTHTGGLPPLPTLYGAMKRSMENDPKFDEGAKQAEQQDSKKSLPYVETTEELFASLAKEEYELLGAPGKEFSYSNDGYALLGVIIARVSGQVYEEYIKEHILDLIGMENSLCHMDEIHAHEDVAILYNSRKKDGETIVFESNNPWDATSMRASGFLNSSMKDMLKYTEIYRNGGMVGDVQVLTNESVEQMMTPFIELVPGSYYGYGLMITPDFFGYKLVEHSGGKKGVSSQMSIIPELGLTGVALANLAGVPSSKMLSSAFKEYLGKPFTAKHISVEEVDIAPDLLYEYEGDFLSGEGMALKFYVKDEKFFAASGEYVDLELKFVGNDSFLLQLLEGETTIRFVRNEGGKVIRVAFGSRQISKVKGSGFHGSKKNVEGN